jgi:hypothetical protein
LVTALDRRLVRTLTYFRMPRGNTGITQLVLCPTTRCFWPNQRVPSDNEVGHRRLICELYTSKLRGWGGGGSSASEPRAHFGVMAAAHNGNVFCRCLRSVSIAHVALGSRAASGGEDALPRPIQATSSTHSASDPSGSESAEARHALGGRGRLHMEAAWWAVMVCLRFPPASPSEAGRRACATWLGLASTSGGEGCLPSTMQATSHTLTRSDPSRLQNRGLGQHARRGRGRLHIKRQPGQTAIVCLRFPPASPWRSGARAYRHQLGFTSTSGSKGCLHSPSPSNVSHTLAARSDPSGLGKRERAARSAPPGRLHIKRQPGQLSSCACGFLLQAPGRSERGASGHRWASRRHRAARDALH